MTSPRGLSYQKKPGVNRVKDAVNTNNESCQKLTSWLSYIFYHKMRTKGDWDAIEPILELREVGKSQ